MNNHEGSRRDVGAPRFSIHTCVYYSITDVLEDVSLLQFGIRLIGHRLKPFGRRLFARHSHSEMGKPTIGGRTVPMLDIGRDIDHITRPQTASRLAPLLIPAFTGHTYQQLASARRGMMYMQLLRHPGSNVTLAIFSCSDDTDAR